MQVFERILWDEQHLGSVLGGVATATQPFPSLVPTATAATGVGMGKAHRNGGAPSLTSARLRSQVRL